MGGPWDVDIYPSKIWWCKCLDVKANTDIWIQKHLIASEQGDSGVPNKDAICYLHREPLSCRKLGVCVLISSTGSGLHQLLSSLLLHLWAQKLAFVRYVAEQKSKLPIYSVGGGINWRMLGLLGATPLKKTDSPPTRSFQLSAPV
jgi:hypothetical protein